MILPKQHEPNAASLEIQDDVSRDKIASAFHEAMAGHLRSHVPGTNINDDTFIASDYLNQFHELVMLLDALPTDPASFAGDLTRWHPVTYEEHFERSGLAHKDLAIAAYRRAPEAVREQFDTVIAQLQGEALRLIAAVGAALDEKSQLKKTCKGASARLRDLIEEANGIANATNANDDMGNGMKRSRVTIDNLFRLRWGGGK